MAEAAAPAPTPSLTPAPSAPTPAPAEPAAFDWKTTGMDAQALSVVETKGWKTPQDTVSSYVNLEKLVGVPPEQIIKLPKEMNDATMGEVWDRLGRPKTAADYKLAVPEGETGEFAGIASKWFHEAGLSASQAGKVNVAWNKHVAEFAAKQKADYAKSVETGTLKLKTEWGDKHDSNTAVAKQAATTFGMDAAQISKLEQVMGYDGTYRFLFNVGSKLGESEFISNGGKPGGFAGTSVESARAQITANNKDKTFAARFNSKDPVVKGEARAEMKRLHQIAFPGTEEVG